MNLVSRNSVFADLAEYSLAMTAQEYQDALKGKPITHQTACATVSGTWTVKFKKNSKAKHKQLVG